MPSTHDEEAPLLEPTATTGGPSTKTRKYVGFGVIAAVLLLVGLFKYLQPSGDDGGLKWEKSNAGIYHARISLPLDYNDPDAGQVSVALAKLPASNPKGKLGSLLINPGGPGGSGTALAYHDGANISQLVDGRYDIIGFDPRGINLTTPRFQCTFGNSRLAQELGRAPLVGEHGNDDSSYGNLLAQLKLEGASCSAVESGKYVSTALVATDMLHISRALGDEKLNYWGFSYGSVLGNTFAQMYPEHVGRMIVDGVMDATDYYNGKWLTNLENTEDVLHGFYTGCEASEECAINGTAKQIRHKIESLLEELKTEPIVVVDGNYTGLVTYDAFKGTFFTMMYSPSGWKAFAKATADLLNGNATTYYADYVHQDGDLVESDDGGYAARCGDAANSTYNKQFETIDQLRDRVGKLSEMSPFWSENWAVLSCPHYTTVPVMLWDGPFQKVNASMLLIGNTYDPVTPLSAARKMSQFYTNGIVLNQDGYGHCSQSQRSECTNAYIRNWFLEGELPANNTICAVDEKLFE